MIEALLLVDRVTYLKESGVDARLQQVFDDRISPRCFVMVAEKTNDGRADEKCT